MPTFIADNLPLILGFVASTITGLLAYWRANRSDDKAKDEFLFGSINRVVELLQADNAELRKELVAVKKEARERIAQLEARIAQLESIVAAA